MKISIRNCSRAFPRADVLDHRQVGVAEAGTDIDVPARLPNGTRRSAETASANTEADVQRPATRGSHTLFANHCVRRARTVGIANEIGPERVVDAGERRDVGDDVDRVATLCLLMRRSASLQRMPFPVNGSS